MFILCFLCILSPPPPVSYLTLEKGIKKIIIYFVKKQPKKSPVLGPIPAHSKGEICYWKVQWICHVHLSLREMKMNRGNFLPTIISSLGKHQSSAAFSPYSSQLRGYLSSENEILLLRSSLQKITAGAGLLTCPCRGFWASVGPFSEV